MSTRPLPPPASPASSPGRSVRVEYLGFQNVAEHREFRLRVYGPDGSIELRVRIAIAAFGAGGVRLQDGPDVCYQKVARAVAAGETVSPGVITIDPVELASYRAAHTQVPKHKSWTSVPPPTAAVEPGPLPGTPSPELPVTPLVTADVAPALEDDEHARRAILGVV